MPSSVDPLAAHRRCSNPPPPRLWRVHQDTTQSREDEAGNVVARDSARRLESERELGEAVRNHTDWSDESGPSCFLSAVSVWDEALRLARWHKRWKYRGHAQNDVEILLIDTSEVMRDTDILLPVSVQDLGGQLYPNEVLVLHRIPARAVLNRVRLDSIADGYDPPSMQSWASTTLPRRVVFESESDDDDSGTVNDGGGEVHHHQAGSADQKPATTAQQQQQQQQQPGQARIRDLAADSDDDDDEHGGSGGGGDVCDRAAEEEEEEEEEDQQQRRSSDADRELADAASSAVAKIKI